MKKIPNYLAQRHEHSATLNLPFLEKIQHYQKLSEIVKLAWQEILPEEALSSLRVICQENDYLIISTDNHTLANHLNYSKKTLLDILQQFDPTFNAYSALKFQVRAENTRYNNQPLQCNQPVSSVTSRELGENTKQTIAHLAKLVTHNKRLYDVLQKFLDK